jgi:hypothetical protein
MLSIYWFGARLFLIYRLIYIFFSVFQWRNIFIATKYNWFLGISYQTWFSYRKTMWYIFILYSILIYILFEQAPSWSYGSWIYNYLCNQCLSPLALWVRILLRRGVLLDTTLCDKVCQWLAAGRWFSQSTLVSSTNKTDNHDISEILLKVMLNTINPLPQCYYACTFCVLCSAVKVLQ